MPDTYTVKARIAPVLLVVLPLILTVLCWHSDELSQWKTVWYIILASGGGILLAQLGRTRGKLLEQKLFEEWGGKPTTVKLRINGNTNAELVKKYHIYIAKIMPEITLPSEEDENNNSQKSDNIYDSIVRSLITKTRDIKKYPLIFKENCNYGFRRNLWGLKIYGIPLSILGTVITGGLVINNIIHSSSLDSLKTICLLGNFILCLIWLFIIKPSWVKIVADAYAERLLESTENLVNTKN